MQHIFSLEGQTALVTGGATGLGLAMVQCIKEAGGRGIVVSSSPYEKYKDIIERLGEKVFYEQFDITMTDKTSIFIEELIEKYGKIDILVNNAGGYPSEVYKNIEHQAIKLWEWSEEQWDQIIKTNLRIPFLCMSKVLPIMIRQNSGKVVSVSSRMGRIASQMGAYAVAKGAIITMTKTAAIQTQEYGIQVNAVSPGIVDTPGQRVYNHSVGQDDIKMGSAADVAKAILYLLCDAPQVMTGQSIDLFTTV